jgi:dTMP kinase
MSGLFITFEGGEGTGKSTQVPLLVSRLRSQGYTVRALREPGGTPIGEEIRHTLKHSPDNGAMTAETELLLMNASRAQLVREVIRPALAKGEIVVSDRFYDSTIAYQGYGRGLPLNSVRQIIDFAVGGTRPDLTLVFAMPPELSEHRRVSRQTQLPFLRDRLEEAGREFFRKVTEGYAAISAEEPGRVRNIDASGTIEAVRDRVWLEVRGRLEVLRKR